MCNARIRSASSALWLGATLCAAASFVSAQTSSHYYDSELERVRREVARRGDEFCCADLSPAAHAELVGWADQLRAAAP
jgi:hypothetical protein